MVVAAGLHAELHPGGDDEHVQARPRAVSRHVDGPGVNGGDFFRRLVAPYRPTASCLPA